MGSSIDYTGRPTQLRASLLAALALLSACGEGGGSNGSVVVVPGGPATGSTPAPTPTPTPATPTAEELEYQRSSAAYAANAAAAYRVGATGRGVRIAVIDTGITPGLAEFAGRIDLR